MSWHQWTLEAGAGLGLFLLYQIASHLSDILRLLKSIDSRLDASAGQSERNALLIDERLRALDRTPIDYD